MFYYHLPWSSHQIKLTCVYWMQNALCQALHVSFRDPRAFQHYFAKQKTTTYLETASLRNTTSATRPYVQFSLHFAHNFCTKYFSNKIRTLQSHVAFANVYHYFPYFLPQFRWNSVRELATAYSHEFDMIYLLTAIGLSPGGSTHLHTNNT